MGTTPPSDTKILTAQCFCKAVHYTITVPTSDLPLPVHLCHCSVCRYTHGALCTFHAPLPDGIEPQWIHPSGPHALTTYKPSATARSARFFCRTCGCHVGDATSDDGRRYVASSIFDDHGPAAFQIRAHACTRSAPGGGLYDWLPRVGARDMEFQHPDADLPVNPAPEREVGSDGEERLRAQCHCGGVSFTIPRPSSTVRSDGVLQKFVSPHDARKWLACLDVCDDCRLVSGTHAVGWTFVPRAGIEPAVGPDLRLGTAATFASSAGVLRAFCGVCGATVFFANEGRAPSDAQQVVDVAVGLLRAPEGVKAEEWLTWRAGRLAFHASGARFDKDFAESLAEGLEKWSIDAYGTAATFEVG